MLVSLLVSACVLRARMRRGERGRACSTRRAAAQFGGAGAAATGGSERCNTRWRHAEQPATPAAAAGRALWPARESAAQGGGPGGRARGCVCGGTS